MPRSTKQPFASLEGLPPRDDAELRAFMDTTGRLPRENVEEIARNLYRAALGHERTGDPTCLTYLAEDTLVTMRIRGNPERRKEVTETPARPGDPAGAVDVDEVLSRWGL